MSYTIRESWKKFLKCFSKSSVIDNVLILQPCLHTLVINVLELFEKNRLETSYLCGSLRSQVHI